MCDSGGQPCRRKSKDFDPLGALRAHGHSLGDLTAAAVPSISLARRTDMHLIGSALEKYLIRQVHCGTENSPPALVEAVTNLDASKPGSGQKPLDLVCRVDSHMSHMSQAMELLKLLIRVVEAAPPKKRRDALERVEIGRAENQGAAGAEVRSGRSRAAIGSTDLRSPGNNRPVQ